MRRRPLAERFADKVEKTDTCWLWTGSTHKGRGRIAADYNGVKVKLLQAARVSWELHVGPIPQGYHIHHRCETRSCVNPAHLEVISPATHTLLHQRRSEEPCPQGHAFTPENFHLRPDGSRVCRICDRERNRNNRRAVVLADP